VSPDELLHLAAKIAGNTMFIRDASGKFPTIDYRKTLVETLHNLTNLPVEEIDEVLTRKSSMLYVEAIRRRRAQDSDSL
jgi:hypothetical protein